MAGLGETDLHVDCILVLKDMLKRFTSLAEKAEEQRQRVETPRRLAEEERQRAELLQAEVARLQAQLRKHADRGQ